MAKDRKPNADGVWFIEGDAYIDGYETGKAWQENYWPGGPWKFSSHQGTALEDRLQKDHQRWHKGFAKGYEENPVKKIPVSQVRSYAQ